MLGSRARVKDEVLPPARAVSPGVRSSRGRWPGGEVPAAGQLACRTVYTPSAFRDRLAKGNRGAWTPWP